MPGLVLVRGFTRLEVATGYMDANGCSCKCGSPLQGIETRGRQELACKSASREVSGLWTEGFNKEHLSEAFVKHTGVNLQPTACTAETEARVWSILTASCE